jgi:hypothetical protein
VCVCVLLCARRKAFFPSAPTRPFERACVPLASQGSHARRRFWPCYAMQADGCSEGYTRWLAGPDWLDAAAAAAGVGGCGC